MYAKSCWFRQLKRVSTSVGYQNAAGMPKPSLETEPERIRCAVL